MGRMPAASLTDREAEIMEQLWNLGTATSEQIRVKLPGESHDSTIRTMLRMWGDQRDKAELSYAIETCCCCDISCCSI